MTAVIIPSGQRRQSGEWGLFALLATCYRRCTLRRGVTLNLMAYIAPLWATALRKYCFRHFVHYSKDLLKSQNVVLDSSRELLKARKDNKRCNQTQQFYLFLTAHDIIIRNSTDSRGSMGYISVFPKFCFWFIGVPFLLFFLLYLQRGISPCFLTDFRPQVVFACITTFLVNVLLTEFAKQHMALQIEPVWKLLGLVFWG